MTYNGVIFLIVADMLTYVEDRKNKLIFLFISFLCYMVCSYNLVTMFIPLNSFETWVAFYDGETEKTPLISAITIQGKTLTIKTVRTTDMSVFDEITIRK